MTNIIDLAELATTDTAASAVDEIAATRKAIMNSTEMTHIVLGSASGRQIRCRFDENARAIYPEFDIKE